MSTTKSRKRRLSFGLDRFSGLYFWGLFIVIFSIWKPQLFPTLSTVHQIASGQATGAMVGIAVLIPLSAGVFDLSVGAVANFSAVVVVVLQTQLHWGMWSAIGAAVVISVVVGIVNGFFVVVIGINSFIATLAVATILGAMQTIVTGGNQPLPILKPAFVNLAQWDVFGFQIVFVYLIIMAFIAWWMLSHTPVGRYLYAVGDNAEAARLSGIRVGRWSWLSLILSSTICGIAGVFYSSIYGPDLSFGQTLLLPAFAAAFLGSTQIHPGRFNVWGSMLAVFALATGVTGLQLVTGVQWLSDLFNGIALLAAVGFAVWRQKMRVEIAPHIAADDDESADIRPPTRSEHEASGGGPLAAIEHPEA